MSACRPEHDAATGQRPVAAVTIAAMKNGWKRAAALAASLGCASAWAQSTNPPDDSAKTGAPALEAATWRVFLAPITVHYSSGENHRYVILAGAERQTPGGFVMGATVFRNTFAQPAAYACAGRRFSRLFGHEPLFLEATAGVLYGYRGEFKNRVPFNHKGFAPGAAAGLGWQFAHDASVQVNMLGLSALMLQFNLDLH